MATLLKSSLLWQFVAGFALGAAGLVALHPSEARAAVHAPIATVAR
ncbi:hypothetical protein [Sphingomonas bacterium]|nr:hypothetical protein [Sphingomonas bacterium]